MSNPESTYQFLWLTACNKTSNQKGHEQKKRKNKSAKTCWKATATCHSLPSPPNNKCEMRAASWPTSSSFLSNLRRVATDQLQSANPSHRESGAEMKGKAYKTSREQKSLASSAADVHTPQCPLLPVPCQVRVMQRQFMWFSAWLQVARVPSDASEQESESGKTRQVLRNVLCFGSLACNVFFSLNLKDKSWSFHIMQNNIFTNAFMAISEPLRNE